MRRIDFSAVGPYAVALVISIGLYCSASHIAPVTEGQLGADVWPKAILVLAIITCLAKIGLSFLRAQAISFGHEQWSDPAEGTFDNYRKRATITPWIGIGLTAAYVFSFSWIGYPLATFLYVASFVYFGNYRQALVAIGVGAVASLGFMFLFMRIVYVSLPIGADPFAHVSTILMKVMGIK